MYGRVGIFEVLEVELEGADFDSLNRISAQENEFFAIVADKTF